MKGQTVADRVWGIRDCICCVLRSGGDIQLKVLVLSWGSQRHLTTAVLYVTGPGQGGGGIRASWDEAVSSWHGPWPGKGVDWYLPPGTTPEETSPESEPGRLPKDSVGWWGLLVPTDINGQSRHSSACAEMLVQFAVLISCYVSLNKSRQISWFLLCVLANAFKTPYLLDCLKAFFPSIILPLPGVQFICIRIL